FYFRSFPSCLLFYKSLVGKFWTGLNGKIKTVQCYWNQPNLDLRLRSTFSRLNFSSSPAAQEREARVTESSGCSINFPPAGNRSLVPDLFTANHDCKGTQPLCLGKILSCLRDKRNLRKNEILVKFFSKGCWCFG
ncbi:MAG: hypothetical protein DMG05_19610, partial [Acidobacteria bacterium]